MNENPTIVIQPVANGFVVTLPYKYPDQWDGLKGIVQPKDPLLEPQKQSNEDTMTRTENVHIFSSFLEVLSFLSKKYGDK